MRLAGRAAVPEMVECGGRGADVAVEQEPGQSTPDWKSGALS